MVETNARLEQLLEFTIAGPENDIAVVYHCLDKL